MDDKHYTGTPDNKRINTKENYEVEYWTAKFGVSREELQQAVNTVGTSTEEVEKYLKK